MGNALVQLTATGPQNIMLNANPEGTLFKSFFRRITMFAIEAIPQTFIGTVDFGNKVTAIISRNGDLLSKMIVEVTLPGLISTATSLTNPGNDTYTVEYVDNIGHHILREVELEIGGISVVKHYGHWMHIWQELTRPQEKDLGYYKMIGNKLQRPELSNTGATGDVGPVVVLPPSSKLYIPLQFWFCKNYSLAFPFISCQYHDVKVHITFENLDKIVNSYVTTNLGDMKRSQVSAVGRLGANLYVDYIFLDTDERRNFATSPHEYLIEQVQLPSVESHSGQLNISRNLDGFNHPVKEIVWVLQLDSVVVPNLESEYKFKNLNDFSVANAQIVNSAKLLLNGAERFQERSGDYFNWVQPYQHHTRSPSTGIYTYSFATEPENAQPTGTCNFSRIDSAKLELKLSTTYSTKSYVYMVNYNIGLFVSGMFGQAYSG